MGTPTGGDRERRVPELRPCFLAPDRSRRKLQICKRNGKDRLSFLCILPNPRLLVTESGVSHNLQPMPTLERLTT